MESGALVSDDLILEVVAEELDKPAASRGVVFDGVVRTIPQAEGTAKLLADRGRRIQHVLFLDVSDEEILARIAKRRSQETRADDAPEAVARRLAAYRAQTAPVLSWFESRGGVHRIAGTGTVEEISDRIREALGC
jgi:adenylate kinase